MKPAEQGSAHPPDLPIHILVMADDAALGRSLLETLREAGLTATCGGSLLTAAQDPCPPAPADILLLETRRLGDREWELIDRVRTHSPLVEIIVISADPGVEAAVMALRGGIFTLLEPPVTPKELLNAVAGSYARKHYGERRLKTLNGERGTKR